MSAICGVLLRDGSARGSDVLDRMLASMADRGDGGALRWDLDTVSLGCLTLETGPGSSCRGVGAPPSTEPVLLAADARIDNGEEITAALGTEGEPGREPGDTDLVLRAYARWGEASFSRLIGDFSLALWDRGTRTLYCARDHFGVKPLYYHLSPRLFAFATEIKALLAVPDLPRRLNEARVADYLMSDLEDKAATFYLDILRLPPGHCLAVGPSGTRLWRFSELDPSRELCLASDREYGEAFRTAFIEAVRCRLRGAHPVGALLSGGLDSSSIVGVARELLTREGRFLQTFSAVFDGLPSCDERPFIRSVTDAGAVQSHFTGGDRLSAWADLAAVLHRQDEPFYAPNLFLHLELYRLASLQGVRVLLDGLDGDTSVSHGLGYLTELARKGRWIRTVREVHSLAVRLGRSPWRLGRDRVLRPLASRALHGLLPPGRWPRKPLSDRRLVRLDFLRRSGWEERAWSRRAAARAPGSEREAHHGALEQGIVPFALEVTDRAAASLRIEARYPFFDKRLAQLCLSLPGDLKLRRGWTRWILRYAMEGYLPEMVRWRSGKAALGPNFVRAVAAPGREALEEILFGDPRALEPYVVLPALERSLERLLSGPNPADALAVWKAGTLASWLRATDLSR